MKNNILQLQAKLEKFVEGRELNENEFLLKFSRFSKLDDVSTPFGFLAKLNKDGSTPKRLKDWGAGSIYVVDQNAMSGWDIVDYRAGQSQDWIVVKHPDGYLLEVYAKNFFTDILRNDTIVNGKLQGAYKWIGRELEPSNGLMDYINPSDSEPYTSKRILELN